ncbi:MAG: hypothetical protein V1870_03350, partial [Candidatus Aenigmatarchaeota archaeon]
SEIDTREYSKQILDVLEYLHSYNPQVMFRDMKPSNIMKAENGVKLIDFGIARFYSQNTKSTVIGTPGYAAPEQYLGTTTPLSDIFGLGATMFTFLSAEAPQLIERLSELRSDVSKNLIDIVGKAMELDYKQRYQTATEMRDDMNNRIVVAVGSFNPIPFTGRSAGGNPSSGQNTSLLLNPTGFVVSNVYENRRALKRIDDTLKRIQSFLVDPVIGSIPQLKFNEEYYKLARHENNVDMVREILTLSSVSEAIVSAEANYPKSDIVTSMAFMYGEHGATLVYLPKINPITWIAEGMAYDKGAGWWRADPRKYDKLQKGLYKEKRGSGHLVVFEPNEFSFPDYRYNGKIPVPFVDKNNATGTFLDVFNIQNHGLPERFADNFSDAVKEYEEYGILDFLLKQGSKKPEKWIHYFYRLQNGDYSKNYPIRCVRRDLRDDYSRLDADNEPDIRNDDTGGRFSRWV